MEMAPISNMLAQTTYVLDFSDFIYFLGKAKQPITSLKKLEYSSAYRRCNQLTRKQKGKNGNGSNFGYVSTNYMSLSFF